MRKAQTQWWRSRATKVNVMHSSGATHSGYAAEVQQAGPSKPSVSGHQSVLSSSSMGVASVARASLHHGADLAAVRRNPMNAYVVAVSACMFKQSVS
jgi:hypothetical protein